MRCLFISANGPSPYFFFGPLLTIGGFGVDFVDLLPPFFDILTLLLQLYRAAEMAS